MIDRPDTRTTVKLALGAALCWGLVGCGGGGGGGADTPSINAAPSAAAGEAVAPLPTPVAAIAPAAPASAPAPAPAPAPALSPPSTSPSAAPAPAPLPAAIPVAALAAASPTTASASAASDTSCGLNGAAGIEAEILQRVNALRASGAVCGTTGYAATGALAWNTTLLTAAKGHSLDMAQKNYFSHISQDGRSLGQRITAAGYNWSNVGENIAAGQTSVEQVMNSWIKSPGHCQNLMNPNFRDVAVACMRNDAADYRLYWTMNLGRSR